MAVFLEESLLYKACVPMAILLYPLSFCRCDHKPMLILPSPFIADSNDPAPMATFTLPVSFLCMALSPIATFCPPPVMLDMALLPTATFTWPVIGPFIPFNALLPKAVLPLPLVLFNKALSPKADKSVPETLLKPAAAPIK